MERYAVSLGSADYATPAPATFAGPTSTSFYWVLPLSDTVNVTCQVNGQPAVATASYNIQAPTFSPNPPQIGYGTVTVDQYYGNQNPGFLDPQYLHFGSPPLIGSTPVEGRVGAFWDYGVTNTLTNTGQIGIFQLASIRHAVENNGSSQWVYASNDTPDGVYCADTAVPMGHVTGSPPQRLIISDSPAITLPRTNSPYQGIQASATFQDYFMYRPSPSDLWSPIGETQWTFAGIALDSRAGWSYTPGSSPAHPGTTVPVSVDNLPTWSCSVSTRGITGVTGTQARHRYTKKSLRKGRPA
jgi:hypothetical protein